MRSWKSLRLTSHTWLGLNPQIGRPLSRIVVPLVYLYLTVLHLSNTISSITQKERNQREEVGIIHDSSGKEEISNKSDLAYMKLHFIF
jgi:hypothetical protein